MKCQPLESISRLQTLRKGCVDNLQTKKENAHNTLSILIQNIFSYLREIVSSVKMRLVDIDILEKWNSRAIEIYNRTNEVIDNVPVPVPKSTPSAKQIIKNAEQIL